MVHVERLVQHLVRAKVTCGGGDLRSAESGHQDHRAPRRQPPDVRQQRQVVRIGQPVIQHHRIDRLFGIRQQANRGRPILRLDYDVADVLERLSNRPPDEPFILDDEDPQRGGFFRHLGKITLAHLLCRRTRDDETRIHDRAENSRPPFKNRSTTGGRSARHSDLCGKEHGDGGPSPGRTLDTDAAVVGFDEALGRDQAQP